MKGYMESGEFSRGKESIRGFGSLVMVGNFEVDVEHQQRLGHLFGPLPSEMRDDTTFTDRIHSYIPGWNVPKVSREQLTEHFGLVSDFLSSCWNHLRSQSRVNKLQGRILFGGALSGRDTSAVQKSMSGLLKLMLPDSEAEIPDDALPYALSHYALYPGARASPCPHETLRKSWHIRTPRSTRSRQDQPGDRRRGRFHNLQRD
jgi:ATP-dependent Lon protease